VSSAPTHRRWSLAGDLNGFFGLVVDNLAVMAFLATVLVGLFKFPADIVFTRMFPGTALGVLVGDLIYTWMAVRLARRSGRDDVTAMPLGIDTPTTVGLALLVLGPAFVRFKQGGLDEHAAAIATWHLGMAAMIVMGLLKLVLSFAGEWVNRVVPRAGLLGSIAGIALMLIGFLPIVELLRVPVVGFVGLGIVLYAIVAKGPLPGRIPGVLAAFLVGLALYYSLGPLGLLMVIGGINVTESARAAGDDYRTRDILLTEAFSTLVAGVCGGVAQTTPYIGQPAYKKMGARAGYTLLTAVFVGLGGIFGYISNLVELVPLAVLAPILVFVSIEITAQAFDATPRRHAAAVVFSFFPAIARMLAIKLGDPSYVSPEHFAQLLTSTDQGMPELGVIVALGNGFIITSMIWAGFVAALVDRRTGAAIITLTAGAVLTLFGVIHSVEPGGGLYLPWQLSGVGRTLALQFAAGYTALAAVIALLSLQREPGAAA
jgi:AGZA family xanthine/uracil permease-like MFS transporter